MVTLHRANYPEKTARERTPVTFLCDPGHILSGHRGGYSWQHGGVVMPILLMGLVALVTFALIGLFLTAAVVLEHSKHARLASGNAADSGPPVAVPPLHPKA